MLALFPGTIITACACSTITTNYLHVYILTAWTLQFYGMAWKQLQMHKLWTLGHFPSLSCPGNNAVAVLQPLLSSFSSQEGVAVVSSDCDGAAHSCCFYPLFRMFNTLHQQQCYVWQAGSYQWPFCVPHSNVQVSQVWDCIHGEPSFNNVHVHNTGSTVRIARWDHLTHPVTAPSQLY